MPQSQQDYRTRPRRRYHQSRLDLSQLGCSLKLHRHGPVVVADRRAYAQCSRCGIDMIRTQRGWRRARPGDLPAGWEERPAPSVPFPWLGVLVVLLIFVVVPAIVLSSMR